MKNFISFIVFCLVFISQANAQVSGNAVLESAGNQVYNPPPHSVRPAPNLHPTTHQYLIEAKVLHHAVADRYIAVFGVAQEERTAEDANAKINRRIDNFRQALSGMGIPEKDIFVDLITQTRVYDFIMENATTAKETVTGIELKKNVHVTFPDMRTLEDMMLAAAAEGIFDIVKVDYVIDDVDKIYREMRTEALAVVKEKKEMYLLLEEKKYVGNPYIVQFQKGVVQPINAYRKYTAHETNAVSMHPGWKSKTDFVKLSARRMTTHYFDPLPEEQFDRVTNAFGVEPTVQLTMTIQVRYDVL